MKPLRYSLILVLCYCASAMSFAHPRDRAVRIGMTRLQLAKAFPQYKWQFESRSTDAIPRVLIEAYDLHGMRGTQRLCSAAIR